MKRSFGFVVAGAPRREPDLSTSDGLIRYSEEHGQIATAAEVARRTMDALDGKRTDVTFVGDRVAYTADVVRAKELRERQTRKHQIANENARHEFGFHVGKAYDLLSTMVGEERAAVLVQELGEEELRRVWALPKRERKATLEKMIKRLEGSDGDE